MSKVIQHIAIAGVSAFVVTGAILFTVTVGLIPWLAALVAILCSAVGPLALTAHFARSRKRKLAYLSLGVLFIAAVCLLVVALDLRQTAETFTVECQQRHGRVIAEDLNYLCQNSGSETASMETSMLSMSSAGNAAFLVYLGTIAVSVILAAFVVIRFLRRNWVNAVTRKQEH